MILFKKTKKTFWCCTAACGIALITGLCMLDNINCILECKIDIDLGLTNL